MGTTANQSWRLTSNAVQEAHRHQIYWSKETRFTHADDGMHGRELWSYSLKSNKHKLVRDIRTGSKSGSNPSELSLNGQIFFAAEGDIYGRELWSSDGKKMAQTSTDINPGGLDSDPKDLILFEETLYFIANTYFNGRQILKLDGRGINLTEVKGSLGAATASEPSELHASAIGCSSVPKH